MNAQIIAKAMNGKPNGSGWLCICPAHDDTNPSLSVSQSNGKVLVKCHAGCSQEAVIDALKKKDLWSSGNGNRTNSKIIAIYDYQDPHGEMVFQVCRKSDHEFVQRRPDPLKPGDFIWKTKGITLYPYRLPNVLKADIVFVVEGEKDVETLERLRLVATTNPGGAAMGKDGKGKWRLEYNKYFKGKAVFIIPDNDAPGKAHAENVARNLHCKALTVRIVDLPGLPPKGDVTDWVASGGTVEKLVALAEAAPDYDPAQATQAILRNPPKPSQTEVLIKLVGDTN